MRLNKIQEQFSDLLLNNHPLENMDTAFAELFVVNGISLSERLKIYQNNRIGALTNALRHTFPLIEKLVGEEFFMQMAKRYILTDPPTENDLNNYGHTFDTFILGFKQAASPPYLYDVARFEIAWNAAYSAEDDTPLKTDELAAIFPEQLESLHLQTRNSLHLMTSPYPLKDIRAFCLAEDRPATLDLGKGAVFLMIYRPALHVKIIKLNENEFFFLKNIKENKTLGDSFHATLETFPEFDMHEFLKRHLQLGTFRSISHS